MTATAPAPAPVDTKDHHSGMFWALAIGLAVLAVVGVIAFGAHKSDQAAQQKAQELSQKFAAAGLPVPSDQEAIVRQLGSDGGYVCHDPANALARGLFYDQLTNGADFVGRRPVIADTRVLQGELLIIQTYCPDKLQAVKDKIGDLKTDDTVKD